jgi:hypothetical protein
MAFLDSGSAVNRGPEYGVEGLARERQTDVAAAAAAARGRTTFSIG